MKDPIVQEGAAVLRAKAKPVLKKDIGTPALTAVITQMKDTLAAEDFGVAIAAPQIGASLRIFCIAGKAFETDEEHKPVDIEEEEEISEHPDMVFINPVLKRLSKKKKELSEGCLSVRGMYGTVIRHEKATVEAWDEHGRPFTYHGSGLIAHIFQHEVDHLDGILYIDKAVKLEEDEDLSSARQKLKDKHGI
jgi:peptide deformylase